MNIPDEVRGQVERVVDRPDRDTQSAQRRDDAIAAREAREAGASTRAEPAATARPVERPATIVDLSDDAKRYLEQREAAPAAPSEAPPVEAPAAPQAELTQSVSVAASNGRDQQAISEAAQSATTAARLADVAAEESRRPDAPGNDTQNGARIDIQRFRDDLDARMKLGVEARMNPAEITRAVSAYAQA